MNKLRFKIIIGIFAFITTLICLTPLYAQTAEAEKLQCTAPRNNTGEAVTYSVGAGKLSKAEKKRIEEKYGTLPIPEGETEAALERRQFIRSRLQRKIDDLENIHNQWVENFPNATAEEKKKWRNLIDKWIGYYTDFYKNTTRLAMKAFDWRDRIDVGPVINQGDTCNTCWAHAATDAAAGSLEKQFDERINMVTPYLDPAKKLEENLGAAPGAVYQTLGDPRPFVQDLLNCMPIAREEICNNGWHGKAFNYMTYVKGVPSSYQGIVEDLITGKETNYKREYKSGEKFECRPSDGFYKAYEWDYVNSPPDELPTVRQLKEALTEHGPIVAPIVYDSCLGTYKGGVFNEQNLRTVNHVVLLIGWDDDKGAWLVKNSWGEEWGEKGFAWIKYGSNNIGMFAAWIDVDGESKVEQNPCTLRSVFDEMDEIKKKYADQTDSILVSNPWESNRPTNIVTISGYVATEKDRKKLLKYIKEKQEKSKCIEIKYNVKLGCSDDIIETIYTEIYQYLESINYTAIDNFPEILVNDNTLTLKGKLKTKETREKIYNIVKKFKKENKCIKKIVNNMTVGKIE